MTSAPLKNIEGLWDMKKENQLGPRLWVAAFFGDIEPETERERQGDFL